MNWYKKAKLDSIYNIFLIISGAPERILKDVKGNDVEIKADSAEQARKIALNQYTKIREWNDERNGRAIQARLNKERMQEIKKYRESTEQSKKEKEERAQRIYEN